MRILPALPQPQLPPNANESPLPVIHVALLEKSAMAPVLTVEHAPRKTGHAHTPLRPAREACRRDTYAQLSCHWHGSLNRFLAVRELFIVSLHRMTEQMVPASSRRRTKLAIVSTDDGARAGFTKTLAGCCRMRRRLRTIHPQTTRELKIAARLVRNCLTANHHPDYRYKASIHHKRASRRHLTTLTQTSHHYLPS